MTQKDKGMFAQLWNFFCSLKLTIILLLLLALTSIIGTLIQQNAPAADYIREYGQANYELFKKLQFTDMYHSTWFIAILALFSINLICCSLKNFPRVWKFIKEPMLVPPVGILQGAANRAEFTSSESQEVLVNRLEPLLKKAVGKTIVTEQEGKVHLFAQKGIYSRFGAYITHLSILIIMAGAIIGNVWGYKAYVNIVEGDSISQVVSRKGDSRIDLGFTVRCDNFEVIYYGNSQRPKDYYSDLVILENGKVVPIKGLETTRIEVNKPLTYKGITFYQSSYGPAGGARFKIRATDNSSGKNVELMARQGQPLRLPGGYSFTVTNFTEDYVQNGGSFGPAIQMHVNTPDNKPGTPFIVWKNYPQLDSKRGGVFNFTLLELDQPQFTGLQIAKDPGVNIVWLGCFLMVFGSLSAFFFSHQRVWVCLERQGAKTRAVLAGNAHRNQPGFALAFEELEQKIETAIQDKSKRKEG